MMYDASNRKDIRRAEKFAKITAQQRIDFICAAMAQRQGRAWFYDILSACHLFSEVFTGQALQEAFLKGERNIGLRLFSDINSHCPQFYILMIQEANERELAYDRSSHNDSTAELSRSPNGNGGLEGPITSADPDLDLYNSGDPT